MLRSKSARGNTSAVVVVLETNEVYIVVSLSTAGDTQVICVDPTTGALRYQGKQGEDLFDSEAAALNHITNGSRYLSKSTTYAKAVLGYAVLGSYALLLVATQLSATVPGLPGGGCIYTVVQSQWIKIQLQNPQAQGNGELKNVKELADLDIDGKYYFCETRDVTRPFPSRLTLQEPDEEFVWNGWLSRPFKDIGLPGHCVILLQGFAECRSFGGTGQQGGLVALLARRSRLHPGTRYLARGLNACSGTGNEVECEQLVWAPQKGGQIIPFSSYIWRRGTIPIWWGAEIKNAVSVEAEIYVADDPYNGTLQYYQRLGRRYGNKSSEVGATRQKKPGMVPIVCVNLLRYAEGKPETILVEHFKESLKYLKSTGKLGNTWIQLINYDWHATVKSKGQQQTVEGLWRHLKAPTMAIGFSEGNYYSVKQQLKECKGSIICNDDGGFCMESIQNGVVLSRPSGCMLKPVPSITPMADDGSSLLSFKKKDLIWVCQQGADYVELFIYLGEPCQVSQLLLTVSHGVEDSSYPVTVDVRVGSSIDALKLVLEGACIPQCSNGTNLLIPLTGRIDPEDLAVTGRSARPDVQESTYLPLLYDFEELEGEVNFLNRVVALSFHPSAMSRTPITLGEIEVLGVSLPWEDMLTNSKCVAQILELIHEKTYDLGLKDVANSSSPKSDVRGSERIYTRSSPSVQPGGSGNFVDFLTGDIVISNQSKVTANSSFGYEERTNFFDDEFDVNPFASSSEEPVAEVNSQVEDRGSTQFYLEFLELLSGNNKGKSLNFEQMMKLEIKRLYLDLSAAERDRALLSIGVIPATVDPNRSVDYSYLLKLSTFADRLALLGHAVFEDCANASIGLEKVSGHSIDFWNISENGESCSGGACEVCTVSSSKASATSGNASLFVECSQCERTACKACCAGKGAFLLLSNTYRDLKMYGGSQGGGYSALADSSVCKSCCSEVIKHALYVDYVRVLHSLRRKGRSEKAALRAVNQVCQLEPSRIADSLHSVQSGQEQLKQLLDDEESLAEFPHASFLHMVETAGDSAPLFSLLAPLGSGVYRSYWKAPQGNTSVEFPIVLSGLSDVSGVAIIVSSCGYSSSDCPIVEIWASNKIQRDDRTFIGKWDVQDMIVSSPQLCGPENSSSLDKAPRHIKLHFPNPICCRIITIKMTLPQIGSHSTMFNEEFDLSLDESSFIDSKPKRAHNSFIHAKRIVVFGSSLPKEMGPDTSAGLMRMKSCLDGSPSLGRFRIPVEAERLTDNDLVLEQYLLPNSPGIAGFRLDSFSVIRPRVTHSPLPSESDMREFSLTRMEDRHLNPAILHIQVTVVKESGKLVVEEYRIPEVKANTPLYFDFLDLQQDCRCVIFRLLGDVTAFVDDIAEIDGLNLRNLPLASGLSLSNKVKLYYYADTYEMGKIGSLSAA
ncbi:hypothetical protein ACQ4PT_034649 [Festuca glaucescens]